jgi:hypothetical protein
VLFVALVRPKRTDPFFRVKHPKLESSHVRGFSHFATERVDLLRYAPFAAAYRRIARHLANSIHVD